MKRSTYLTLTLVLGLLLGTTVHAQPSNPAITQLFAFACDSTGKNCLDGNSPNALIQSADGNFYGTTFARGTGNQALGTVFKITSDGQLTTLYNFVADQNGNYPNGAFPSSLVEGNDGSLYGTTQFGGSNGNGVVFKLSRTGKIQLLHSFCSLSNCADGVTPDGLQLGRDGNFYGAAFNVFWRISPKGSLTLLHTLNPTTEGHSVLGMAQASDGNFYGTTTIEGFVATLFRLTPAGQFTVLDTLRYPRFPTDVPTQASNGKLYLGRAGGALFETDLSGRDSTEFLEFGRDALGVLTQASDANLWGLISVGDNGFGNGDVVTISAKGKPLQRISFDGANGAVPTALVQGSDGRFLGVTITGGTVQQGEMADGVVFRVDAALAKPKATIVAFNPSHGSVGSQLLIHGSHFVGASAVAFNGVSATFRVLNTGNIVATVPQGATTGPVSVTNPGGTTTSRKSFTVQ